MIIKAIHPSFRELGNLEGSKGKEEWPPIRESERGESLLILPLTTVIILVHFFFLFYCLDSVQIF